MVIPPMLNLEPPSSNARALPNTGSGEGVHGVEDDFSANYIIALSDPRPVHLEGNTVLGY